MFIPIMCHMSRVTCHMSLLCVTCHMPCVICVMSTNFSLIFVYQNGGDSCWRVCYQGGPLVLFISLDIDNFINIQPMQWLVHFFLYWAVKTLQRTWFKLSDRTVKKTALCMKTRLNYLFHICSILFSLNLFKTTQCNMKTTQNGIV